MKPFPFAFPFALVVGAIVTLAAQAETGKASWYGSLHEDGRERPFAGRVACPGRRLGPMTAAHKSLPCGTRVRVTTPHGSVVLTITDRGPYVRGRIIDVSPDAARVLGLISPGYSTRGPGVLPATVEVQ
jgi:rare lipoprotein A